MDDISGTEQAVEQLQQLGLKEYEARAFVALSRLPSGTAKKVSEISEVPRTRVYEAVRVLETKGLVEIQHSNPQVFRALSVEEAVDILLDEYETRANKLQGALEELDAVDSEDEGDTVHEVWALSGSRAIDSRTDKLIDGADDEIALVLGTDAVLADGLLDGLQLARRRSVSVLVGTTDERVRERVETDVPGATVFTSGLDWLSADGIDEPRILLVDRDTILLSTSYQTREGTTEQAVFGRGFTNGVVAIVRQLIETGLNRDTGSVDNP